MNPPPTSLYTLTDRLAQLEDAPDTALTAVAEEIKSPSERLESRLTDIHNKADKLLNTKIGALADCLVFLARHVVIVEDGLS